MEKMPHKDKEKRSKHQREYHKKYWKEYSQRPEVKERIKRYRKKYWKKYYQGNKEELKLKRKAYQQKPEVKLREEEYIKAYKQKPEVKLRRREKRRKYYRNNFHNKISILLRNSFCRALKHYSKTGKIKFSCEYGINYKAIIEHLKPLPKDIENYHVDHIIPLCRFDFNNPEHIKIAFAPENHQWLTIKENLEKNNRLVMPNFFKEK